MSRKRSSNSSKTSSRPQGQTNVISLNAARELKRAQVEDYAYQAKIITMSKLELLNEMVDFQEERTRVGKLTPEMMVRGKVLFRELEKTAETGALRSLTRSYRRHLEFELKDYIRNKH